MKEKRYSKKREGILACLRATDTHPGAEEIYRRLKPAYPDLSLGTVYRNLRELCEEGLIAPVATVDDKQRYDGNVSAHSHLICARCGKVVDLFTPPPASLAEDAARESGFAIREVKLQFVGLCGDCRKGESDDAPA